VTTIKFADHKNDPRWRLDLLLQMPESSVQEGKTKIMANTTLDLLYMSILQASGYDDPEDDPKSRSVLGAVILAINPLPPPTIAVLLRFSVTNVFLRLPSYQHSHINHSGDLQRCTILLKT